MSYHGSWVKKPKKRKKIRPKFKRQGVKAAQTTSPMPGSPFASSRVFPGGGEEPWRRTNSTCSRTRSASDQKIGRVPSTGRTPSSEGPNPALTGSREGGKSQGLSGMGHNTDHNSSFSSRLQSGSEWERMSSLGRMSSCASAARRRSPDGDGHSHSFRKSPRTSKCIPDDEKAVNHGRSSPLLMTGGDGHSHSFRKSPRTSKCISDDERAVNHSRSSPLLMAGHHARSQSPSPISVRKSPIYDRRSPISTRKSPINDRKSPKSVIRVSSTASSGLHSDEDPYVSHHSDAHLRHNLQVCVCVCVCMCVCVCVDLCRMLRLLPEWICECIQ